LFSVLARLQKESEHINTKDKIPIRTDLKISERRENKRMVII
jgi:hypothetical protein